MPSRRSWTKSPGLHEVIGEIYRDTIAPSNLRRTLQGAASLLDAPLVVLDNYAVAFFGNLQPRVLRENIRALSKDGLVHISQISDERVERVSDRLREGDLVRVKVLEVDRQGRILLSMRNVDAA